MGELPKESVQYTCGSALAGTLNWRCHQKKWSHRADVAAGANLAAPTATAQLNLPQCLHPAAPGVLLGQKGAGWDGQPGRDLSSGVGLQLLQEPLMLHLHPSHHPLPAVPPLPELPEGTPVRREGHMGWQGFLGTQGCSGSDFLPGPEELESWAPSLAERDGNPASITNNDNVGKPLHRAPPLHCRGMSLWLGSAIKAFNYQHDFFFVVLIGPSF